MARATELPLPRRRLAALRDRRRPRHGRSRGSSSSSRTPPTRYAGLGWLVARLRLLRRSTAAGSASRCAKTVRAPVVIIGGAARVPQHPRPDRARAIRRTRRWTSPAGSPRERGARDRRGDRDRGAARAAARRVPARARSTEANEQLDEARAIGELVRRERHRAASSARATPGRAIVDEAMRRGSEIIVMGGPRRVRLAARAARDLRRHGRLRPQARARAA